MAKMGKMGQTSQFIYGALLVLFSTIFVHFLRVYCKTPSLLYLALFYGALTGLLYTTYMLLNNSNTSDFMIVIFIKVIPIIFLTILDFVILTNTFNIYKGVGLGAIIGGIFLTTM